MLSIFTKLTLLITLSFSLSSSAEETPLAIKVCKNTTDFDFCRKTIYTDPHANTDDPAWLANIIFGLTHSHATDTRDHIDSQIKKSSRQDNDDIVLGALKGCLANYNETVRATYQVLGDINSDSYFGFDKVAVKAEKNARACESGFNGRSPLTERNLNSTKLANICYVISQFFPYSE